MNRRRGGNRSSARLAGGNGGAPRVDDHAGSVSTRENAEEGSGPGNRGGRRGEKNTVPTAQTTSPRSKTSQRGKRVRKSLQQHQVVSERSNTLESNSTDGDHQVETVVEGQHSSNSSTNPSSQDMTVSPHPTEESAEPIGVETPASPTSSASPTSPTTLPSSVTPNINPPLLDADLLPPNNVPGTSTAQTKKADKPKSSKVLESSEPGEQNPSNLNVPVVNKKENKQRANRDKIEERKALIKLRDEDKIKENTFPSIAAKHALRRPTPNDKRKHRCLECGEGHRSDSRLLQCQGKMNGRIPESDEDPENCISEERCSCMFHIECLKEYNAGDFNLQYSVRAECQGKLQCPLHCCEKCNLERHKQSAYQGDIIECDLCMRAFHSVSCLPAGCEMITKEIDGRKYRRIICDAHCSGRSTTPVKHIEVCSAVECQIRDEDKENSVLQKCTTCVRSFHVECKVAKNTDGIPNVFVQCDFCVSNDTIRIHTPVLAFCPPTQDFRLGTISDWSSLADSEQPMERRGKMLVEWKHEVLPTVSKFLILPVQNCAHLIGRYCEHLDYNFNGDAAEMLNEHQKWIRKNRPKLCKVVAEEGTHCRMFNSQLEEVKVSIPDLQTTCSVSCTGNCLDSSCDNFSSGRECPDKCKEGYQNNQIRNGKVSSKIGIHPTESKGLGVFSPSDIVAGEFFATYVGDLIDEKEKTRRHDVLWESQDLQGNLYMMDQHGEGMTIDAAAYGNIARYFNHHCEPNARIVRKLMWVSTAGGSHHYVPRVFIEAKKDIKAWEEITIAYEMKEGDYLSTCDCGSTKCTKTMGIAQNDEELEKSQSASQRKKDAVYYRSFAVPQALSCLLLENVDMSGFINSSLNLLYRMTTFREWILSTSNDGQWINALRKVFNKTEKNAVEVRGLMAPEFHIKTGGHNATDAIANIVNYLQREQKNNGGVPSLSGSFTMTERCSTPNCTKTSTNDNNGFITYLLAAQNASLQSLIDEAFPATLQCVSCGHGKISKRYDWTPDADYHIISLMQGANQRLKGTNASDIVSLFGANWNVVGFIQLRRDYHTWIRDGDNFFCVSDAKVPKSSTHLKEMKITGQGVSSILLKRIPVATSSEATPFPDAQTDGRKEGNEQDSVEGRGKRCIEETSQHSENQQPVRKRRKTSADGEDGVLNDLM